MSARGAIPPNITDALNSPTGHILMINGKLDTAKSLFVREIIGKYKNSYLILSDAEAFSNDGFSDATEWNRRHAVAHYWRTIDDTLLYEMSMQHQLSTLLDYDLLLIV